MAEVLLFHHAQGLTPGEPIRKPWATRRSTTGSTCSAASVSDSPR